MRHPLPSRIFAAILVIIVSMPLISGCTSDDSLPEPPSDTSDSDSILHRLNTADDITLTKKTFTMNDQWNVEVEGTIIATIEGKTFPVWGDTYVMRTMNGNLMASEAENIQFAGHGATLYDYENKHVGTIKDELFSWGYKFHVIDADGKDVGYTQQKIANWSLTFDIKDAGGTVEYHVSKKALSFNDELTIERKNDDTRINGLQAVWLASIINEISNSDSSDSSH